MSTSNATYVVEMHRYKTKHWAESMSIQVPRCEICKYAHDGPNFGPFSIGIITAFTVFALVSSFMTEVLIKEFGLSQADWLKWALSLSLGVLFGWIRSKSLPPVPSGIRNIGDSWNYSAIKRMEQQGFQKGPGPEASGVRGD